MIRPVGRLAIARAAVRRDGSPVRRAEPARRATNRMVGRSAFTLTELLIVIAIIALLSGASLFAMYGIMDEVKADRTKSQIERIGELLNDRWESYHTRVLPLSIPVGSNPQAAAQVRLSAIRDLMRMEMPDRVSDVADNPVTLSPLGSSLPVPSLLRAYRRRCAAILGVVGGQPDYSQWTTQHQGAECLYLILTAMNEDGTNAASDFFSPTEIGDIDGDGMPEIHDGWGRPIEFLRWAPGFPSDRQSGVGAAEPDPFDPLKVDPRWHDIYPSSGTPNPNGNEPYALFPLVFSAGPDGLYDMNTDGAITPAMNGVFHYAGTDAVYPLITSPTASSTWTWAVRNDPYWIGDPANPSPLIGTPMDANGDGRLSYSDNIHNHLLEVK